MKRVCVSYETGNGRLGGHYTQFSFWGLPGVEVVALADSNPAAEKTYRLTGAKKLYTDTLQMLEAERPDIVVLCSRQPEDHAVQIPAAIRLGCHVLVEKPFAADLLSADAMVAQAKAAGIHVQIAHLARFAPVFREMKRRMEAGEIGRVLGCYMRGEEDVKRGGGEDMMVLGTHLLDVSCYLFGRPESVSADVRWQGRPITATDVLPTSEPLGLCAGDEIFATFRYPNGVRGIFESRRGMAPFAHADRLGIVVSGTAGNFMVRYKGERHLQVSHCWPMPMEGDTPYEDVDIGPEPVIPGAIPIDYEGLGISISSSHKYYAANNRRAAWNLLQAIEGKEPLAASAESAVDSLEMIQGTYRSSLEGGRLLSLPLAQREHPLRKKS
ncbi:MAG: Gfo/Idh/MocA family oxidoreductase [Victivallales bacterium]|nr:Gfo/Idh/MocA family oxidoreductase [Victivallales bacterium]